MALSRGELKLLVKELLVEILSEGLGNVQAMASAPPRSALPIRGKQGAPPARRPTPHDPRLDTPIGPARAQSTVMKETIRREAGGNPIMASILADTAATTLQTLSSDRGLGSTAMTEAAPGIQAMEHIAGTPEEVFGEEVAGRWADLAFAPSKKTA